MKITVRLYRQTDLDLIGLCCADGMSVSKELKKCLVAFVRGVPYSINLKPIDVSAQIVTKKSVTLQFYLENKTHSDVINWLKTIRPRQRNSFLRNLLRSSLPCPYLYMYQTNQILVNNMIADIYDRQIELENNFEEVVPVVKENKPVITKIKEENSTISPVVVQEPIPQPSPVPKVINNTPPVTPEPIPDINTPASDTNPQESINTNYNSDE